MAGAKQAYHPYRNQIEGNDVVQQLGHDQDKNARSQRDERHQMNIHIVCVMEGNRSATI